MANREYVSFNQDINDAIDEQEKLKSSGYVVVESYGSDYDMGNVYEYSLGEDREDVLKRHKEHIEICNKQRKLRGNILSN